MKVLNNGDKIDRCTGHCCQRLTLPFNPGELQNLAKLERMIQAVEAHPDITLDVVDGDRAYKASSADAEALLKKCAQSTLWQMKPGPRYAEIERIADMVIYLGYEPMTTTHRGKTLVEQEKYSRSMKHYYRCKNLLANGDCGVYETRPKMCSEYPYGGTCDYKECTSAALSCQPPGKANAAIATSG